MTFIYKIPGAHGNSCRLISSVYTSYVGVGMLFTLTPSV